MKIKKNKKILKKADTNRKCPIYSLKKIYDNYITLNKLTGARQGYKLLCSEFKTPADYFSPSRSKLIKKKKLYAQASVMKKRKKGW